MANKKKAKKRVLGGLVAKKATAVSDKGMGTADQKGYSQREYKRWMREWKSTPGCPPCVIQGRTDDAMWGLAILHPDDEDLLISHVAYPTRAERKAFAAGVAFVAAAAAEAAIKRRKQ